jgi:hypothetical protein
MNNFQFNSQLNGSNPLLVTTATYFSFDWYDLNSLCALNEYVTYSTYEDNLLIDVDSAEIVDVNSVQIGMIYNRLTTYLVEKKWEGIGLQTLNSLDITNINVESWESSLSNGGGVIDKRYGNKTVTAGFYIQGSSHSDLIARIQEFKKETQWVEKNFILTIWGIKRTYTATVTRFTVPRFSKLDNFVENIQVDFLITSPLWTGDAVTTIDTITWNIDKVISNDWDTDCLPRIILLAGDTTAVSVIRIGTRSIIDTEAYDVTLTTSVVAWDIIDFNWEEKTVTKNNIELPFSGVFMSLPIGLNVYECEFTGTANFEAYFVYNPVYL